MHRYIKIVLPPIEESFDKSFKSETPLISDARIKGTAISFNELINIETEKKTFSEKKKLIDTSKFEYV